MKGKVLKKAALGMALGACLASMAPLAMAQSRDRCGRRPCERG